MTARRRTESTLRIGSARGSVVALILLLALCVPSLALAVSVSNKESDRICRGFTELRSVFERYRDAKGEYPASDAQSSAMYKVAVFLNGLRKERAESVLKDRRGPDRHNLQLVRPFEREGSWRPAQQGFGGICHYCIGRELVQNLALLSVEWYGQGKKDVELLDNWGHAIVVLIPGKENPVDFYSLGKNGRFDDFEADDIVSWGQFESRYWEHYQPASLKRHRRMRPWITPGAVFLGASLIVCSMLVRRSRRRKGVITATRECDYLGVRDIVRHVALGLACYGCLGWAIAFEPSVYEPWALALSTLSLFLARRRSERYLATGYLICLMFACFRAQSVLGSRFFTDIMRPLLRPALFIGCAATAWVIFRTAVRSWQQRRRGQPWVRSCCIHLLGAALLYGFLVVLGFSGISDSTLTWVHDTWTYGIEDVFGHYDDAVCVLLLCLMSIVPALLAAILTCILYGVPIVGAAAPIDQDAETRPPALADGSEADVGRGKPIREGQMTQLPDSEGREEQQAAPAVPAQSVSLFSPRSPAATADDATRTRKRRAVLLASLGILATLVACIHVRTPGPIRQHLHKSGVTWFPVLWPLPQRFASAIKAEEESVSWTPGTRRLAYAALDGRYRAYWFHPAGQGRYSWNSVVLNRHGRITGHHGGGVHP